MLKHQLRNTVLAVCSGVGKTGIFQKFPDLHNNIIMYHSVGGSGSASISNKMFRRHLCWLDKQYEIVDLPDVLGYSNEKKVALTFDDGYQDFYDNVVPILAEYSAPATVFVTADALKYDNFMHDEDIKKLEKEEYNYMGVDQLKDLVNDPLISIGSHTMSHPNLSKIEDEDRLHKEIGEGTRIIERMLKISIDRFCYPYNKPSQRARSIVAESCSYAVYRAGETTLLTSDSDPLLLPRISGTVDLSTLKFFISDTAKRIRNT